LATSEVEGPGGEKSTAGGAVTPAANSIDEKDYPGAPTRHEVC
jgi:hypothetical protein